MGHISKCKISDVLYLDSADLFKNTVYAKRLNDLVMKLPHMINALFLTALDPELVIPSV